MDETSREYGDIAVKVAEYKRCPDYIVQKFTVTHVSSLPCTMSGFVWLVSKKGAARW